MFKATWSLLAVLVMSGAAVAQQPFAEGQEWALQKINSMNGGANFIILKIEDRDGLRLVHGSVVNRMEPTPDPLPYYLAHIPITEEALRRSVVLMTGTGRSAPNGFEAAYRKWKAGCGGVFDRDMIHAMAAMIESQAVRPVVYDISGPDSCKPIG
jgi:hypothetical protein